MGRINNGPTQWTEKDLKRWIVLFVHVAAHLMWYALHLDAYSMHRIFSQVGRWHSTTRRGATRRVYGPAMSQGHMPSLDVHHGLARGKWEGDGRRGGAPCGGAPWEWARAHRQAAGMALLASDRKGDGSRVKRGSRRTQQGGTTPTEGLTMMKTMAAKIYRERELR